MVLISIIQGLKIEMIKHNILLVNYLLLLNKLEDKWILF